MTDKEAERLLDQYYSASRMGSCKADNSLRPIYDLQIIIPAYNEEKYIQTCLNSILKQKTTHTFLVTIINDGSTDRTREIVEAFIKQHGNEVQFELINQENRGFSGSRNRALELIKGKYITFLDSDDLLAPNAIDVLLSRDVDIVQAGMTIFKDDKIITTYCEFSGHTCGKAYRAELWKNFKFPDNYWFEDTAIWLILLRLNCKKVLVNQPVYNYRINDQSITMQYRKSHRAIDTFYITRLCLEESDSFKVVKSTDLYETYLRQFITNWNRTKQCPRRIREAIFILEGQLIEKYFASFNTNNEFLAEIAEVLRNKQFGKFELLSLSYLGQ